MVYGFSRRIKSFLVVIVVFLSAFLSCSENENSEKLLPSNLVFEVHNSNDGSGFISVNAMAENATSYEFLFGEDSERIPVQSSTGIVSYTYSDSGTYGLEIRALDETTDYISETTQISVIKTESASGWIPGKGYFTPMTYAGWNLVWWDEFGEDSLDESIWNYEIGTGHNGWGNNESQYYRKENTMVKGGYLFIEAREEAFGGSAYTSSRLTTESKFYLRYGRVDIRACLPWGQGVWPALWMLGGTFRENDWPGCGEIDIMEMVGGGAGRDNVTHGTIHWDYDGYKHSGGAHGLETGILYDEFHVYSIEWDSESIKWYLDDSMFFEADITHDGMSEFQNYFFFLFNVAVGGNWPGYPNQSTQFPQRMIVDYIRAFQKPNQIETASPATNRRF